MSSNFFKLTSVWFTCAVVFSSEVEFDSGIRQAVSLQVGSVVFPSASFAGGASMFSFQR